MRRGIVNTEKERPIALALHILDRPPRDQVRKVAMLCTFPITFPKVTQAAEADM